MNKLFIPIMAFLLLLPCIIHAQEKTVINSSEFREITLPDSLQAAIRQHILSAGLYDKSKDMGAITSYYMPYELYPTLAIKIVSQNNVSFEHPTDSTELCDFAFVDGYPFIYQNIRDHKHDADKPIFPTEATCNHTVVISKTPEEGNTTYIAMPVWHFLYISQDTIILLNKETVKFQYETIKHEKTSDYLHEIKRTPTLTAGLYWDVSTQIVEMSLSSNSDDPIHVVVSICDSKGKSLQFETIDLKGHGHDAIRFPMERLQAGTYFVFITESDNNVTFKFSKP